MDTVSPPAAYSIDEAARQLSLSRSTVYELIRDGQPRVVKVGRRSIVSAGEIARFLEAGER